jgi:CRISPR-associated protein Cmr4
LGALDRPILRESGTGFPIIQSPTIKGALRAILQARLDDAEDRDEQKRLEQIRDALFGVGESDGNMGCVAFTDSQVLLFPVRSLVGTFAWVTSPLALSRIARLLGDGDALRAAICELLEQARGPAILNRDTALGTDGDAAIRIGQNGSYCLEQLVRKSCDVEIAREKLKAVVDRLAELLFPGESVWSEYLTNHLLLLCDDDFSYLVHHATEVRANIRIGESGATDDGSLRYTEYLPAETILWSLTTIEKPFKTALALSSSDEAEEQMRDVLGWTQESPKCRPLQVGGDESTGKGITRPVYAPLPCSEAVQ